MLQSTFWEIMAAPTPPAPSVSLLNHQLSTRACSQPWDSQEINISKKHFQSSLFPRVQSNSITGFCPTWLQLLSLPLSHLEQERGYMKQGCRGTSSFPEAESLANYYKDISTSYFTLCDQPRPICLYADTPGKRQTFELS